MIGIGFVVLVHALVIWALMTGLARKAIEVIKKPLTATIIQEIKLPPPPPPPPPKKIIEAPKVEQPVQTYVPPPDIPAPATTTAPVISAITAAVPTTPHVIAPPPVVVAPPPPPKPAIRRGSQLVIVEKEDVTYPREAIRANIQKGLVTARLRIDEKGNVTDVEIMSSDPPRVFDREVKRALSMWKFKADGEKYVGEIEIAFKLD